MLLVSEFLLKIVIFKTINKTSCRAFDVKKKRTKKEERESSTLQKNRVDDVCMTPHCAVCWLEARNIETICEFRLDLDDTRAQGQERGRLSLFRSVSRLEGVRRSFVRASSALSSILTSLPPPSLSPSLVLLRPFLFFDARPFVHRDICGALF